MSQRRPRFGVGVFTFLLVLIGALALAEELPDSEINFQSGDIESVGSIPRGGNLDVRHVVDPGQGSPKIPVILTSSTSDDHSPRIAIEAGGDTWVVWWRDGSTDEIRCLKRDYSTGTWTSEQVISSSSEDSRDPAIVLDSDSAWVAYEIETSSGTDIGVVASATDDPWPFPGRSIVASTAFSGNVDVSIHEDSGSVWVTWVDSSDEVGWREYSYEDEDWLSASYESYATGSVEDARGRIEQSVLGG